MNRFDPKNTHCIEISAKRNRRLFWQPTGDTLRGRWSLSAFPMVNAQESLQKLSMLGDIPGMFVQVDTKNLICRITDPLESTEKGRDLFKKIEIVCKGHPELFGGNGVRIVPAKTIGDTEEFEKADQYSLVKTWSYWMRRALKASHAAEVAGYLSVPTMEEIRKLPGKTDAIPMDDRFLSDRFRDNVPIPQGKSTV